jgi:hypothetical protein
MCGRDERLKEVMRFKAVEDDSHLHLPEKGDERSSASAESRQAAAVGERPIAPR